MKMESFYSLHWQGEEIDEAATRKEAQYLRTEYTLAYGGTVTIKSRRRYHQHTTDCLASTGNRYVCGFVI